MMAFKTTEKGQALVLIALVAIGLFAFAALAIDGSMAFSDKRHAQNAADTSALAAALTWIRDQDWNVTLDAAQARAASNGYDNNGMTNIVEVNFCNDPNATCTALPTGADPTQYIEVRITSHVKVSFARVIGITEVVNRVEAVARAVPGYRTSTFGGNALVSLNTDACPAFDYGGGSTTTVTGSGIFVNSRCDYGSNQALNSSSNNTTLSVPCYTVVGGGTVRPSSLIETGGCTSRVNNSAAFIPNPLQIYQKANIPCGTDDGTYTSTTLNPGNYSGAFPPGGQTIMNPGIYCIDGGNQGFSLSGGQTLTGTGVLIYMKSGSVNWTSGGVHLSAMQGVNPDYDGLLLYLAQGNCENVSITGNGDSSYVGTILAPCSLVKLAGGSSTANVNILENQIISDTIQLTGSNTLTINYNAQEQWQPPIPPTIELNQ